jgi:hypothetical protein
LFKFKKYCQKKTKAHQLKNNYITKKNNKQHFKKNEKKKKVPTMKKINKNKNMQCNLPLVLELVSKF